MDVHSVSVGFAIGGFLTALGYGLFRKWARGNVCHSKAVLAGKTAIVTGANTGIGLETAVDLAKRGARVILACRSVERGERAAVEVRKRSGNTNVVFVQLDLASFKSIRAFAEKVVQEEPHINILVNNAGVSLKSYQQTVDGFEAHMGINHLGHFLLTNLLLDTLRKSQGSSRVVIVSSRLYKRSREFEFENMNSSDPSRYPRRGPGVVYSQSKLANIMFSRSLSKRLEGSGVCVYVLCPGLVRTELARDFIKNLSLPLKVFFEIFTYFMIKTPWQGSQTVVYCAVSEDVRGVSGRYYQNCEEKKLLTAAAVDDEAAEKLWRVSEHMVELNSRKIGDCLL